MRSLLYVTSLLALLFVSACSEAIPTVTDLSLAPSVQNPPAGQISAGASVMVGSSFKITGKIDSTGHEMVGTNFKINTSGDF